MKEIGDDAFVGCDNIADVWYYGTEQDKIRIDFNSGNENLINATWHYNDAFQEPHIHSFANYVYNNDATYDADGTKTATCVCGEKDTITAIGTKLHRHSFANYSYNNDATYDADGTKTATCACGKKDTVKATGTKLPLIDSSKQFSDVAASAWYKPYTDYAVSYKIFNGSGNKMNPDANITRAEFVQVLANLSGVNTTNKNINAGFKDVKVGEWYAPAIKWASTNGIVYGVGDGKFEPEANITREQMCTMLVRYIQSYLKKDVKLVNSKKSFADHAHISEWAIEPVYLCQRAGLVYGISETEFAPGESADRASVATLMTRFHQNYLK